MVFGLGANPPYTIRPDNTICNTALQHDMNTRATVYGDSRMDLISAFFKAFGTVDLDYVLGGHFQGWNVQNFGLSGENSTGLYTHLTTCYSNSNY